MKVRVIRQFLNGSQIVSEGRELIVTERRFKALEANKLVVPIEIGSGERKRGAARQAGVVRPTMDTDEATTRTIMAEQTTEARQVGGPTGEEEPASSSRRGRPRGRPRLRPDEDE